MKKLVITAGAAALLSLGALVVPATAQAQVSVSVQFGPPAPVYERVPAPRPGYVWAPGPYEYQRGRYAWTGGRWLAARPGYAYHAPHWVERGPGDATVAAGTVLEVSVPLSDLGVTSGEVSSSKRTSA